MYLPRSVPAILLVGAVIIPLAICAGVEEDNLLDGIAAYVNESVITVDEVKRAMAPDSRPLFRSYQGAELSKRLADLYAKTLELLIERSLILDAYEKGEARLSEELIEQRINLIMEDMFGGEISGLLRALNEQGMAYEEWRRQMSDNIVITAMRNEYVDSKVHISPVQVRRFYEEHRNSFKRPGRIKLRIMVFKVGSAGPDTVRQHTQAILDKVKAGENFASLAARVSEGSKASNGGDWGWVDPAILRPELAETAAALGPDQVSDIIETREELYILKVEGRQESSILSFSEAAAQIEETLQRREAERVYARWIAALREHAYVRMMHKNIFMPDS